MTVERTIAFDSQAWSLTKPKEVTRRGLMAKAESMAEFNLKLQIIDIQEHSRGKIYNVTADGKAVTLLVTFHALER